MEVVVITDEHGAGTLELDVPASSVHDAAVTRGMGELTITEHDGHAILTVQFSAPSDRVNVGYAETPDHQLVCPFCITPLDARAICPAGVAGEHPLHVRAFHIHHDSDEVSGSGHEQAAQHRARYHRHDITRTHDPATGHRR